MHVVIEVPADERGYLGRVSTVFAGTLHTPPPSVCAGTLHALHSVTRRRSVRDHIELPVCSHARRRYVCNASSEPLYALSRLRTGVPFREPVTAPVCCVHRQDSRAGCAGGNGRAFLGAVQIRAYRVAVVLLIFPRISPPALAVVWTLKYRVPAVNEAICAAVSGVSGRWNAPHTASRVAQGNNDCVARCPVMHMRRC